MKSALVISWNMNYVLGCVLKEREWLPFASTDVLVGFCPLGVVYSWLRLLTLINQSSQFRNCLSPKEGYYSYNIQTMLYNSLFYFNMKTV